VTKLDHRSVITLTESFKQNRQLTFAEQMLANECLTALRIEALAALGQKSVSREARPGDSTDNAALKRRGLLEVSLYSQVCDEPKRAFILSLLREAVRDYGQSPTHARAIPPQVAAAQAARAKDKTNAELEARLGGLESKLERLLAKLGETAETKEG
jgi:hypothetical protein